MGLSRALLSTPLCLHPLSIQSSLEDCDPPIWSCTARPSSSRRPLLWPDGSSSRPIFAAPYPQLVYATGTGCNPSRASVEEVGLTARPSLAPLHHRRRHSANGASGLGHTAAPRGGGLLGHCIPPIPSTLPHRPPCPVAARGRCVCIVVVRLRFDCCRRPRSSFLRPSGERSLFGTLSLSAWSDVSCQTLPAFLSHEHPSSTSCVNPSGAPCRRCWGAFTSSASALKPQAKGSNGIRVLWKRRTERVAQRTCKVITDISRIASDPTCMRYPSLEALFLPSSLWANPWTHCSGVVRLRPGLVLSILIRARPVSTLYVAFGSFILRFVLTLLPFLSFAMTDLTGARTADSLILKSSFAPVTGTGSCLRDSPVIRTRILDYRPTLRIGLPSPSRMSLALAQEVLLERRSPRIAFEPGSPFQGAIPSLMSAFERKADMTAFADDAQEDIEGGAKLTSIGESRTSQLSGLSRYQTQLQYRGLVSGSVLSDSTDSSPTTTISTVDSSSITDSSPSSSPESPTAAPPLSSSTPKQATASRSEESSLTPPLSPFFGQNVPLSPGRRPRNTKNLSLNMVAPTRQPPPPMLRIKTASAADSFQSAPPSPSIAMPARPPKKRPSNLGLSIQTPTTSRLPRGYSDRIAVVPPTPSVTRPITLRHHQSSPSLSLFSPTTGIPGGMRLPPFQSQRGTASFEPPRQLHSRSQQSSFDSASSILEEVSPVVSNALEEMDEEDDYSIPLSQEIKSPAYPSGPVCVYDPHVYLYLEPSDEEASQFDVILNVAREVRNPFNATGNGQVWDGSRVISDLGEMDLTDRPAPDLPMAPPMAPLTFTDQEIPHSTMSSSRNHKATSETSPPEYIHIPWDHNSNIVDDLLRLVEVIDERVRQGKRVLVHCQCGVSRSASLIVAYGLYKDPSLTVQEVYDTVKRKSRWIGPNMSLIYQLSEFRTKMIKSQSLAQPNGRSWRGAGGKAGLGGSGRANTLPSDTTSGHSLFPNGAFEGRRTAPQTAPLPDERDRTGNRSSPSPNEASLEPVNTGTHGEVSPGPSSAPCGLLWNGVSSSSDTRPQPSRPRSPETARIPSSVPLHDPPPISTISGAVTSHPTDIEGAPGTEPPTPALMSPRAATFTINALHEFPAKSITDPHSVFSVDPRSPAQKGEAPIVRSIFDVL